MPTAPELPAAADVPPAVPCPLSTVHSDYFSLLTWLNQPHIQSALEAHDQAVARNDRRRALEALRQALDTADNPTNLRRAATTLLRSTIDRKPDRQGGRPARTPSNGAPTGPACPPDPSPSHRPASPSHAPLPPLPPLPPPTSRPTPSADPKTAFAHIKAALISPQLPLALSTLHAHATPTATFAGHPIPQDPATWPASLPSTLPKDFTLPLDILEAKEVERATPPIQNPQSKIQNLSPRSLWRLRARSPTSIHIYDLALTLIRDGPETPDPSWRLATFDVLRRSG